ncbi:MAG TPA: hypothetical protein VJN64_13440, partial [Terriglobales bacterium]|nr:hypothetical protein [Terriglobales bacterium]
FFTAILCVQGWLLRGASRNKLSGNKESRAAVWFQGILEKIARSAMWANPATHASDNGEENSHAFAAVIPFPRRRASVSFSGVNVRIHRLLRATKVSFLFLNNAEPMQHALTR